MKEAGTTHWEDPNTGATNESGFTALPGGYRDSGRDFFIIGYFGYWWSSTEYDTTDAWYRNLCFGNSNVFRGSYGKDYGFSVRCVKN